MRTIRQARIGNGTAFSGPSPKNRFRHPWKTALFWNHAQERWEAMLSGFVNGLDPLAYGYLADSEDQEAVEVDLIRGPRIPLQGLRSIPGDLEPVPGFFSAKGVRDLGRSPEIDSEMGRVVLDLTPTDESHLPEPRLLFACDLYIAVARAAFKSTITEVDASGASGLVVDYAVTYDTSRLEQVGNRARLLQADKFRPVKQPTFFERLLGQYQDEGEDRILISTVFLLSPPGVTEGLPNALWTPYVQHHVFWNLCYFPRNELPEQQLPPLRLFTGLAGGLGDIIGNQILSSVNEFTDQVANALSFTSTEGKFWSI